MPNDIDRMQEDLLAYVFANMADAVCITAKNGEIYYANNSATKLLGLGETSEGRKIWEVIPFTEKNDILIQLFIDAVTQRSDIHSPADYVNNDGKIRRLHVSVTYMEGSGNIFAIVIRDLTELVRVNSAFERYTSPEIAKYVLHTPGGEKQGGQLRDVSILMSDLRGFTALSTKLPPDTLITILNHYFEEMIAVIRRWKGTLIEFLGDGLFVVFNAPNDDENHANHAVSCAVEMENAMKSVNDWNALNGYPALEMGIGINSGPAVVGNIGSDMRMKYGCMGETVNLAGRVETFTIGGQIYISERTKARITEELFTSDEQSFMPKGAKSPMKIYAVDGIGDIHIAHRDIVMSDVARKVAVSFSTVTGKNVDAEKYSGHVVKISDDMRYAVIESEAPVEAMRNILLDIGGPLYAKALSNDGGQITICFTSKPDCFTKWIEALR
ncbi:MAG: PAS domain S-box protein [Synergistaceae bacterium]|nr:PAS domain S-box protein [Synergistaceae bacterium]